MLNSLNKSEKLNAGVTIGVGAAALGVGIYLLVAKVAVAVGGVATGAGALFLLGGLFYAAFHTGLLASVTISGAYPIRTCMALNELINYAKEEYATLCAENSKEARDFIAEYNEKNKRPHGNASGIVFDFWYLESSTQPADFKCCGSLSTDHSRDSINDLVIPLVMRACRRKYKEGSPEHQNIVTLVSEVAKHIRDYRLSDQGIATLTAYPASSSSQQAVLAASPPIRQTNKTQAAQACKSSGLTPTNTNKRSLIIKMRQSNLTEEQDQELNREMLRETEARYEQRYAFNPGKK
jgi:hypothetical protein